MLYQHTKLYQFWNISNVYL